MVAAGLGVGDILEEWVEVMDERTSDRFYWERVSGKKVKFLPSGMRAVWLQVLDRHQCSYFRNVDTQTKVCQLPDLRGARAIARAEWQSQGAPTMRTSEQAISKTPGQVEKDLQDKNSSRDLPGLGESRRDVSRRNAARRQAMLGGLPPPEAENAGWYSVLPAPRFVKDYSGTPHIIQCRERAHGGDTPLRVYKCPCCEAWVERDRLPFHGFFNPLSMCLTEMLPHPPTDFHCLLWATTAGLVHVVEHCLEATDYLTINQPNAHGLAPLHIAAMNGRDRICMTLLRFKADLALETPDKKRAVDIASEGNWEDTRKMLERWEKGIPSRPTRHFGRSFSTTDGNSPKRTPRTVGGAAGQNNAELQLARERNRPVADNKRSSNAAWDVRRPGTPPRSPVTSSGKRPGTPPRRESSKRPSTPPKRGSAIFEQKRSSSSVGSRPVSSSASTTASIDSPSGRVSFGLDGSSGVGFEPRSGRASIGLSEGWRTPASTDTGSHRAASAFG